MILQVYGPTISYTAVMLCCFFLCVQAIGKISVDALQLQVDYLTIVGHKYYGPRIGALYVRDLEVGKVPLRPLLYGGGQERGFRPG